jgi:hypothetical protein
MGGGQIQRWGNYEQFLSIGCYNERAGNDGFAVVAGNCADYAINRRAIY